MRKNGYMKDDDAVLMHQLKRGRVKALSGLVEKYKKQAYYLALGMVGNSDDAFDISQEAFLRVYQSARTFDDKQPFFPWFYAIVANFCRNLLKKRQTVDNRQVDIDDVAHLLPATPRRRRSFWSAKTNGSCSGRCASWRSPTGRSST